MDKAKVKSLTRLKNIVKQKNGIILSMDNYENVYSVIMLKCHLGHNWKTKAFHVLYMDSWCPKCKGIKLRIDRQYPIHYCKQKGQEKGLILKEDSYINNYTKLNWYCKKNSHLVNASLSQIRNLKSCPECQDSIGEKMCRGIFEHIFQKKFPKVRPNFLKNPLTNKNLELDGFNNELKIAFEYNGQQHYIQTKLHGCCLEYLNITDTIKQDLCGENGVILIIIPYYIKKKELKLFIINQLSKSGILV